MVVMRWLLLAAVLVGPTTALGAGDVTDKRVLEEAGTGHNWFLKGGNFRGEHYSPLTQVSDRNVAQLGLAWAADLDIPDGVSGTPIVVDGVVYLSGAHSLVYAVDASNGEILWRYDPRVRDAFADDPELSWIARAQRGVAVWAGRVFVTTADCRLVALDAGSGARVWSKSTCDTGLDYRISDSPYVGGGKVFLGNSGSETEEKTRGYISAYDADSGELLWRFFIVPSDDPEENDTAALQMAAKTWSREILAAYGGGGHSWNEMTYDPVADRLYFGTSGAVPYLHSQRSPAGGENLFLSSVVAVDASTGEYVWHYQTVTEDSWDYNATMNIVLADIEVQGEPREALLIAPKNGFHYALDRNDGALLAVGPFAKTNWATHIDPETGQPAYDPAGEYWKLGPDDSALIWPNMWGAHSWNPMAYHPGLGLSYIPVVDVPGLVEGDGGGEDVVMVTEVEGKPHAPGKLVAFDPVRGRIRWSVEHELPFNGGLLATAGNLVFQGNANGRFEAYAADTGSALWSVPTGSAINAAPVSYAIDGTQHVLVPIGAGGGLQFLYPDMHSTHESQGPTRLLAFTLDAEGMPATTSDVARPLPDQPKLDASEATLRAGAAAYGESCRYCHGSHGVARAGGSVPDLRYATAETHAQWDAIVIGGSKGAGGMPRVGVTPEISQAIRSYVLSRAEALRASR